ncbi:MAG TPA: histidinol dehydrogenase [Candidatus Limnocylindrales bacterium]|nr:histidinol dehydrogenase [Candidatus Limnocylindrales bacterium]
MNINFYHLKDLSRSARDRLLERTRVDAEEYAALVKPILEEVRRRGDLAVIEYTQKYDGVDLSPHQLKISEAEIKSAYQRLSSSVLKAIETAIAHVQAFHQKQMPELFWMTELFPGIQAGEKITPIESVGLYVPGGRGFFPSTMIMLGIPAVVAQVPQIVVCTPPLKDGSVDPATLVAADLCGIKNIYRVGGVQAMGALAYGTETLPKVLKIIGPGSTYVTAAKRVLRDEVDVGIPAGPSESLILTDDTADPYLACLDLLIEAEHGSDSSAYLITCSERVGRAVRQLLPSLLEKVPEWRRKFCEAVFSTYGGIIIAEDLDEAIAFVNDFAPEHLEILCENPFEIMKKVKNAGEILLGEYTPISASVYALGTNHVLPTTRFARTYSALSVYDFLKRSSISYLTREGFETLKDPVIALAEYEGFFTHAMAVRERRFKSEKD